MLPRWRTKEKNQDRRVHSGFLIAVILSLCSQSVECHKFRTFHQLFIPNNNHSVLSLELKVNETSSTETISVKIENVRWCKPELDVS